MSFTRRHFLRAAPVALSLSGLAPRCLLQAAEQAPDTNDGRVLVVIQLSGGNDGLNTIVPHLDSDYRKARPNLGIRSLDILGIDQDLGFHPALKGFADLLENGLLSIVQGVGYPNPNRSHFESMDIWHTCQRKTSPRQDGWLGRSLDQMQQSNPLDMPAMYVGQEKLPMALVSQEIRIPSMKSLDEIRLHLDQSSIDDVRRAIANDRHESNSLLSFVQSSTQTALDVSERFRKSIKSYESERPYPESPLGRKLQTIAKLIDAELNTRIYYVELAGFDTHANQPDAHAGLLRQLGDAVSAFMDDLHVHGNSQRVVTMCFSEFGRRVAENASDGTDHGTAGPMFVVGESTRSGLIGKHPPLDDLEAGDLKHHTDFRQVYAAILEDWLGCDSEPILNGRFDPVEMFS